MSARIIPNSKAPQKLRVAAYCRVSTRAAEQQSSLMAQEHYYEDYIKQNPSWVFAGVYSDIGSGTRIKGRSKFKSLLSACKRGRVDMILTKSAHRFARNTVDALKTIRMLRRRNIDIYFEQEDIHSLYESSEFILTLICARAQEESFSKSEDIKWGLRKSFSNPDSKYYQRICYGYTHDQYGKLVIDEKQAEIVRLWPHRESVLRGYLHIWRIWGSFRQKAKKSGAKKLCGRFSAMKNIKAVLSCKRHL